MIGSVSSSGYSPPLRELASTSGTSVTTTDEQTSKSSSAGNLFTTVKDDNSSGEATNGLQPYVGTLSDETRGSLLSMQETDDTTTATSDAASLFTTIDQDADGAISEDEFSNFVQGAEPPPPPPPPPAEESSDASSDISDLFATIDSDSDGAISQSELSSFLDQTATADGTTSDDGSTTSGTSGASGSTAATFDAMDTDEDGTVSQAELEAYLGSRYTNAPTPTTSAPPESASASSSTVTAATATDTDQSTGSSDMSSRQMAATLARYATQAYDDASFATDPLAGGGALASQIA